MKVKIAIFIVVLTLVVQLICVVLDKTQVPETITTVSKSEAVVYTPEAILPSGVDNTLSTNPYTGESGAARKGTVAATLNNIALLNTLLVEQPEPHIQAKIKKTTDAIVTLMPSLRVIGIFDLFSLEEWLATDTQPGRVLVATLYLQKYPQKITPNIKNRLMQIQEQTKVKEISLAVATVLADTTNHILLEPLKVSKE